MAKLSSHGQHRQIEYIGSKVAVCSDGNVLINRGAGWKLHAKLKTGVDWLMAYQRRKDTLEEFQRQNPCYARFMDLMLAWKLADRVRMKVVFDLLGDDTDGIWSELNDSIRNVGISLDEIGEIHHAAKAMARETQLRNAADQSPGHS